MNKQQTLEAIKVMQAFAEGKPIEYKVALDDDVWIGLSEPIWNWYSYDYRVKQVPVKLKLWHKDGRCMTYKHTDDRAVREKYGWRLIEVEEKMK